jgi:2-polyprenyl-3-methyl-5-hydroxy-6-metoxy-1,4-benzoquinol methylase
MNWQKMDTKMTKEFSCPICNSQEWKSCFNIHSFIKTVPNGLTRPNLINVQICKCIECGIEFNHEVLGEKNFNDLYTEDKVYSAKTYIYKKNISPKYSQDLIKYILKLTPEKGKLLEIGFLNTDIMKKFHEKGYEVFGIDLDSNAVEIARKAGFKAFKGDIRDFNIEEKMDVVLAIAVLEHIQFPNSFLEKINHILKDHGLLVLQIPNPSSLNRFFSSFSKHNWDMFCEPGHIYHYKKKHLLKLIEANNFKKTLYKTATIRIRGKWPFLCKRNIIIEKHTTHLIHKHAFFLFLYTCALKLLDFFHLGDTHFIIAKKKKQ